MHFTWPSHPRAPISSSLMPFSFGNINGAEYKKRERKEKVSPDLELLTISFHALRSFLFFPSNILFLIDLLARSTLILLTVFCFFFHHTFDFLKYSPVPSPHLTPLLPGFQCGHLGKGKRLLNLMIFEVLIIKQTENLCF